MSLKSPLGKMSKSDPAARSRIHLTDTAEEISKKFNMALTDSELSVSYDPERRPGVSNLLTLLSHMDEFSGATLNRGPADLVADFKGLTLKALKSRCAEVVEREVGPIRERYNEIIADTKRLDEIAEEGGAKARESAEGTMKLVREAVELGV